ncbi:MAG: glucuronate isomerase [Aestuariivirga sp.]|uniref:glucuronate isomerase n=1 Tax=Aestuariivirga sp. TaxID=2650926 RepID=UPI003019637A
MNTDEQNEEIPSLGTLALHPDRLFPPDAGVRAIARRLYASVSDLPIISPHGHTDPRWFATNKNFSDPAALFVAPDHYVFRMLYSQGVPLERLGIRRRDGEPVEADPRKIWRLFAEHFHLFRGTPTRMWIEQSLHDTFSVRERLTAESADRIYDQVNDLLARPAFRPRALFERFNIDVIATTDAALDDLSHHDAIRQSGWSGRVVPTYRPDAVVDPSRKGFAADVEAFNAIASAPMTWAGYLEAHRSRRHYFKRRGATASDHGHPTARTANLDRVAAEQLFSRVLRPDVSTEDAELFRALLLTEMARMSLDDGLVMQLHPGSFRNHNSALFSAFGPDIGADIPTPTDYVHALKPLLDELGNDPRLTLILFTLDETAYSRELAPLAGHYPALRLGPAWWFFDSPDGMRRFRELTTETAGFYNTVGFNDDTRAYLSIPARHDMARRCDCSFLANRVAEHRLDEAEAQVLAADLAHGLAKRSYRL